MPAGNKHPLWWKPNGRHKHTVNNTFEKISNSKPSVRSRRLTSFHSRTYRESEWKSRKSKRARKFPEVYVSPPWDRIPASDTLLLPLLAGGQATVFYRILPSVWKLEGIRFSQFMLYQICCYKSTNSPIFRGFSRDFAEVQKRASSTWWRPLIFSPSPLFAPALLSPSVSKHPPLFKFENWKALGFHSPYYTKLVVTSQRIGLRIIPEKNWYAVKLYLWKDGARQLTNSPVPRLFFFLFFFRIVPFIQNRFHLCN